MIFVSSLDDSHGTSFFSSPFRAVVFAIHARIPISFHVLKDEGLRFYFFGKKFEFFLVMARPRYRLTLVFRLNLVYGKFTFSAGIQLFGLKTTSHGKPNLKNSFLKSDLPCEVVFRPKN